ncbi:MAG: SUMF1/EgtB/PvdO family nonheme iron enzyme, partial [Planctomycetaceae bacterium]|nr:SUMF1/EgtB/PvdO family nonheme iron enzyme [Planctomycetaceae bacterium]
DKNGRAKLTDFGLARAGGGSGHSLSGHVLGTEGYMAPEQYADPRQATALSDQYSLAATLYHLVTGRSPRMIHLRLVPEELQELLATALEESPAKRYASIEAFHQALGQVARRDKPQPEAATTKPTASETSEGDSNLAKLYVELKKQAEQNMVRAWQLYEAYDDEQALTLLRSVPEDLRDVSLEQNVEERLEKGKKLEAEIGQRVRNGRTAGLRALVDQYLKLYPQRKDMISLRAQLPNNETATTQPANEANASNSSATGQTQKASPPSLLVAPFDSKAAQAGQQAWAKHLGKPVQWSNGIGMNFRLIPPGEFMMGNEESVEELLQAFPYAQKDWLNDAYPQHRVRLTRPWYAGGHLVTIGNFRKFVESTNYQTEAERLVQQKSGVEKPSWNPLSWFGGASEVSVPAGGWGWDDVAKKFEGYKPEYNWRNTGFPQTDNHPVVNVSWNDAQAFITWLNKNHAAREINGKYRLATEAEWEYMCRIGTTTRYPNGNDPERLPEIANVWDGTAKAKFEALGFGNFIHAKDGFAFSSPVGSYAANAWGVYDLIGNAWEWCQDWYGDNYYQQFANLAAVDPQGPASGSSRCLRGGSWGSNAVYCRSGCRGFYDPPGRSYDIGFRVLLELS